MQLVPLVCCGVGSIGGSCSSQGLMVVSRGNAKVSFHGQKTSGISAGLLQTRFKPTRVGIAWGCSTGLTSTLFSTLEPHSMDHGMALPVYTLCQTWQQAYRQTHAHSPSTNIAERALTSCWCFCYTWAFLMVSPAKIQACDIHFDLGDVISIIL